MENKITLEVSQKELRLLYKCLAYITRVDHRIQQHNPKVFDNPGYCEYLDDFQELYLRICDEYQDSCKLFGEVICNY